MRFDADLADALDADNVPNNGLVGGVSVNLIKTNYEKKGDPNMSNYSAQAFLVGNTKTNDLFWVTNESYVINNEGSLQKADDLVSSSLDPFSIFKNVAGESITSIKRSVSSDDLESDALLGVPLWTTNAAVKADICNDDYFKYNSAMPGRGTNIDVVFIPDLLMAAVQKMLPALTKLSD